MTAIISPEETMVHAQEAAEARASGDLGETMKLEYESATQPPIDLTVSVAEPSVDSAKVAAIFKPAEPFA